MHSNACTVGGECTVMHVLYVAKCLAFLDWEYISTVRHFPKNSYSYLSCKCFHNLFFCQFGNWLSYRSFFIQEIGHIRAKEIILC
jgi:hypothetical protein